ncbi:MAG: molybdopterin molybdotransferase MoeA [Chloroflexota bacterium]|nr:molybdopterin molybdotransferase MoeA [Chloroflexota bacterium]
MGNGIRNAADQQAELDRTRLPQEALAAVLDRAPLLPVEHVPLDDAGGRFLAEELVADEDHPPFAAATMDGFAVVAEDGSPWREIVGEQTAGYVLGTEVTVGTAVRITTGAPLPPGADAVVPVEATEAVGDHVVIGAHDVSPGQNVRRAGADLRRGEVVLRAGTRLGPAELGLLAGLGIVPAPVRRRPRVSLLSTGDELVEPDRRPEPGQIRDSNRFSLASALASAGADVVWSGLAPDERDPLRRLLGDRIAASDVVVTSGGVSMGELDLIKALLGELATVHFRRVFMKPGKPLNFATAGETLIFGLPGNPVSALVSFELFIRPALSVMAGGGANVHPRVPVALGEEVAPSDRIEYQRAAVRVGADGRLTATPTGGQASSRLASFVGANALIELPPRADAYRPGETVQALLIGAPVGLEAELRAH